VYIYDSNVYRYNDFRYACFLGNSFTNNVTYLILYVGLLDLNFLHFHWFMLFIVLQLTKCCYFCVYFWFLVLVVVVVVVVLLQVFLVILGSKYTISAGLTAL